MDVFKGLIDLLIDAFEMLCFLDYAYIFSKTVWKSIKNLTCQIVLSENSQPNVVYRT